MTNPTQHPKTRRLIADEAGSSLASAAVLLAVITIIMGIVMMSTMGSIATQREKQAKSVGNAAGDSAIESYRSALEAHSADTSTGWYLSENAINSIVKNADTPSPRIRAYKNDELPSAWGVNETKVPNASYAFTARQPQSQQDAWWQIYRIVPPRYNSSNLQYGTSNLVVYFRVWATDQTDIPQKTTRPVIFRAEYRPRWFTDYQMVSESPIVFSTISADIDGPLHSNGLEGRDFLTGTLRGIHAKSPAVVKCLGGAKFSTSGDGTISVPDPSCSGSKKRTDARQINLMSVNKSLDYMTERAVTPTPTYPSIVPAGKVANFYSGDSYKVELGTDQVTVKTINGLAVTSTKVLNLTPPPTDPISGPADSRELSILTNNTIYLSGMLQLSDPSVAARVTIAAKRKSDTAAPPDIIMVGNVGAVNPEKDTVAAITEGNLVLGFNDACNAKINLAATASNGTLTIPPHLVTPIPPAADLSGYVCASTKIVGSLALQQEPVVRMTWKDASGTVVSQTGYSKAHFSYNTNFLKNPPPFWPTTTPWQVVAAKKANSNCTSSPDPRCA